MNSDPHVLISTLILQNTCMRKNISTYVLDEVVSYFDVHAFMIFFYNMYKIL